MNTRSLILVIVAAMALAACCSNSAGHSLGAAFEKLVFALGDPSLSQDERNVAREMIVQSGSKDVLPILIASLGDQRLHNPKAWPWQGDASGDSCYVETAGMACEAILYEIILSGRRPRGFKVNDWKKWWEENSKKDMGDICEPAVRQNGPPNVKR